MTEVESKPPYKLPTFHNWTQQATFYHPLQAGSIDGTDMFPHDKGVLRAMISRYKPNKNITGDPDKTLFVGKLSKDISQDTIQNIFESFGELEKCRLVRDFVTGFSRGFAFVEFKRKRDALMAAAETNKMNIDGREILVDLECERNLEGWKPRRFGGGFGGRKESGQLRFGGIDRPFRRPLPSQVDHFQRGPEQEWKGSKTPHKDGDRGERERHRERDRGGYDRDRSGYDRDRRDREKRRDSDRERGPDHRDKRRRKRDAEDSSGSRVEFEDRERRTRHSSKESSRSRDRDDGRDREDRRERERH